MTQQATGLEGVIRPIVEGQIRSFVNDHPEVAGAIDWYKPRKDKAQTFINSLSKRIIRDLLCKETRVRLIAALLERPTGAPCEDGPVMASGIDGDRGATMACPGQSATARAGGEG